MGAFAREVLILRLTVCHPRATAIAAVLDCDTETWRGVIMARWAVGFALLMAVVLALSYGYHLGAAYIDHVVAR